MPQVSVIFAATPYGTHIALGWIRSARPLAFSRSSCVMHIRTTTNIYGDAGTSDMREAHGKIVGLALTGMETE